MFADSILAKSTLSVSRILFSGLLFPVALRIVFADKPLCSVI